MKAKIKIGNGKEVNEYEVAFNIFKEGDNYIAYCPTLDLSTSAKTYQEAQSNFLEMLQLYTETCTDRQTLILDLLAHGVESV